MKYIFDIDNTLVNLNGYPSPKGKRGEKKYMNELKKMEQYAFAYGTPNKGVIALFNSLCNEDVMFLTSKEERWRKSTRVLLERIGVEGDGVPLIMRPNGDIRSYGRFKMDVMSKIGGNIVLVDDDPNKLLENYLKKSERITLLKVV